MNAAVVVTNMDSYKITKPTKPCPVCQGPIVQKGMAVKAWVKKVYCSNKCHDNRAILKPKESKPCEVCKIVMNRASGVADATWKQKRFCSRKCWLNSSSKKLNKRPSTSQVGFRLLDAEIVLLAKEARKNNIPLSEQLRSGVREYYKKLLERANG